MLRKSGRIALVLISCCWSIHAAAGCRTSQPLEYVVPNFQAHTTIVQAIYQLGRETGICFGIRPVDRSIFEKTITISVSEVSAASLLNQILGEVEGYYWTQHPSGIVNIGLRNVNSSASVFSYKIPRFTTPRTSVQSASNVLRMEVLRIQNPQIRTFMGAYFTGDREDIIGPLDLKNQEAWQVLNTIVALSKGSLWIATRPESLANSPEDLWAVIEYSLPAESSTETLVRIGRDFPEPIH